MIPTPSPRPPIRSSLLFPLLCALGCGGAVAPDDGDSASFEEDPEEDSASGVGGATGYTSPAPRARPPSESTDYRASEHGPQVASCATSSVALSPIWSTGYHFYGQEPSSLFAFSANSTVLALGGNEYAPRTASLDARTGESLGEAETEGHAVMRDRAFSHELRWSNRYYSPENAQVVSLPDEEQTWVYDLVPHGAALSADGSLVATYLCEETVPSVTIWSMPNGESTHFAISGTCHAWSNVPVSFSPDGSVVVVADDSLISLNLPTGAVARRDAAREIPYDAAYYDSEVRAIAVHPRGEFVAVTTVDERLRIYSLPDLAPMSIEWSVGTSLAFENCYCMPMVASPVAWSADGALLATLDEDRNVVVRRACDWKMVGLIDNTAVATTTTRSDRAGPLALAFSPDDSILAIKYEDHVAAHRVTRLP